MISWLILIAGFCVFIAGIVFFIKEKANQDSRKIYGITALIGIVLIVYSLIKLFI